MKSSPANQARIHRLRGTLKPKPGEKSLTQALLEDHAWEKQHEDEKWAKFWAGVDSGKRRSQ